MPRSLLTGAALLVVFSAAACDDGARDASVTLEFRPNVAVGEEAYLCFGFDAGAVPTAGINRIDWAPPDGGPIALHHAKLYALPSAYPRGPIPCDQQPTGAVPLHTWLPGGGSLSLPDDVAVTPPSDTVSLVIEAHVFRGGSGEAPVARARLGLARATAAIRAGWTARSGIVPALRPHHLETSTDRCVVAAPFHVFVAWPHEHLLGRSFQAALTTGAGAATLIDVPSWNFAAEAPSVLDRDVAAGDLLDVTCTWFNSTDDYVLPGPKTTDEMCGLGMIVSPPLGARLPCTAG